MGLCQQLRQVSLPVFLLVMLFSMSTWIDVVGIWVEIPLLVNALPEGWGLPAFLTIIIQCANIGPATYALVYKFRSKSPSKNTFVKIQRSFVGCDVLVSFVIIVVAALSVFLMCFFWSYTVIVAGAPHSVPLFVLVCSTSLVSCMSSVVFLPYMARFNAVYISAYYIGQGLSGLVPGLVGLIQGVGQEPICVNYTKVIFNETGNFTYLEPALKPYYKPPLFSVDIFFGFIAGLLVISLLAFYILNFASFSRKEMVENNVPTADDVDESIDEPVLPVESNSRDETQTLANDNEASRLHPSLEPGDEDYSKQVAKEDTTMAVIEVQKSGVKTTRFALLLLTIGVVSAMTNGILPATQSYTCLPYGNLVYTLSVRLSSVVSPLASLSSMFLPRPPVKVVVFLTVVGVSLSAFQLMLAAQSPTPVLRGQLAGELLVVSLTHVLSLSSSCAGFLSCTLLCIVYFECLNYFAIRY